MTPANWTPSVAALYRNVWRFAAGARLRLVAAMALLTVSQVLKLIVPWAAGQAINALQTGGSQATFTAGAWIALVIAVHAAAWGMHGPGRVLERSVGVRVRQAVADTLYTRLIRVPLAWHSNRHSGDTQHRVGQSSRALFDFAQNQFVYLQSGVNFVGPIAALVITAGGVGWVAVLGYVVVALVVIRFDRAVMRLAERENDAERRYTAAWMDFLGNIATITSLRLQRGMRRLIDGRLQAVFEPLKRSIVLNEAKWCAVDLLGVCLTWGLVALYVWDQQHKGEVVLLGAVFMIYQYAQQAGAVVSSFASNFQTLARARADFGSAAPIWQAPQRPEETVFAPADWRRIELRELGFDYSRAVMEANLAVGARFRRTRAARMVRAVRVAGARTARAARSLLPTDPLHHHRPARPEDEAGSDDSRGGALHEVSLALSRGERIALVGASGSGKSTLLRVLAGLYPMHEGLVVVDGVPMPGLRHLGSVSTLIPQEAEVFEATVRENLSLDLHHDSATIERAIHISAFDTVLAGLPQGLDTPISERGINLSGGQRQRLCLARGVLAAHGSSLLLLDEPTSALDPVTEALVFERLARTFPDACIISSVHRMSLLERFDKVVLMANGRVVDAGSMSDLLDRQRTFRGMMHAKEPTAADDEAEIEIE